jgi:hypothetical protein
VWVSSPQYKWCGGERRVVAKFHPRHNTNSSPSNTGPNAHSAHAWSTISTKALTRHASIQQQVVHGGLVIAVVSVPHIVAVLAVAQHALPLAAVLVAGGKVVALAEPHRPAVAERALT